MTKIPHDRDKTETGDVIAKVRYVPTEPDPPFPEEGARPEIQDIAVDRKTFKMRRATTEAIAASAHGLRAEFRRRPDSPDTHPEHSVELIPD